MHYNELVLKKENCELKLKLIETQSMLLQEQYNSITKEVTTINSQIEQHEIKEKRSNAPAPTLD